ncbi:hypothetical protein [Amnibacterium kyonggiense]|uniref:Uncharacterized protein n=1 Tax=Amnibacterium kyonggiense TaxID=595671 RepID=A0A4R7FRB8_9MICO|nr:hypothetical protein [Amnibacterium kyonggiense]TDS80351.1 hypothetical protein CLV52_0909 [Amnibacterium kyonggiense]
MPYVERGPNALGNPRGVEIWCDIALDAAFERYRTRPRHRAHADDSRLDEWWSLATDARPMSGLPVLRVKTDEQVDVEAVATQIALLRKTEQQLPTRGNAAT